MAIRSIRSWLLVGAAPLLGMASTQALAQGAPENEGLQDIIVTAQKREQSVQDVPIAVTALSGDTLVANRVANVTDLTGLAPGVTVRVSAGGQQLPSFSVRGAVSYGIVPGSDKQVSVYLDGVYISSPRGSIFDLPDMERIEMLRGPQGTLFGRNATAGAVSISTREPSGEVGVRADVSVGNRDLFRYRTSVDLPQIGPFSAYVSYIHDQRHGDIRNGAAGKVWNRLAGATSSVAKVQRSPDWLGSKNSDSWFAAVKFESGDFKTVYKYDRSESDNTPEATALLGINRAVPVTGPLVAALLDSQPTPVRYVTNGKRPDVVDNGWVIPTTQRVSGHSVTSTWQASDSLTVKNIFGARKAYLFTASAIDGFSSLIFTQAAVAPYAALAPTLSLATIQSFVGQPFNALATQPEGRSEQLSDELQVNYNSDFLTATVGALWFRSKDWTDEDGYRTSSYSPVFGGVLTRGQYGTNFNKAISIAAYAQLEFHVTPQLDIVAGGRVTQDKKSGAFTYGTSPSVVNVLRFSYKETRPNYLIGVNYKPTDGILVYGKYSTAYVSGGSVGGIPFDPETAVSWEAGIKTELFDRKLRANLALYHARYKNFQTAQTALNFCPEITALTGDAQRCRTVGTFVLSHGGPVTAKGFEFDFSAAPVHGLTLGGSLALNDTSFKDINPKLISGAGGFYEPNTYRPKWNGGLWGQYDTDPLSGDAYLSFRLDGVWQSRMKLAANSVLVRSVAPALEAVPAYWIVNGRVALRDIEIGGVKTEIAAWGRNLFDEDRISFSGSYNPIFSANFIPARSYGVDLSIKF